MRFLVVFIAKLKESKFLSFPQHIRNYTHFLIVINLNKNRQKPYFNRLTLFLAVKARPN